MRAGLHPPSRWGHERAACCRRGPLASPPCRSPVLLLRLAGARGAVGRWYTAVLRPEATASMVSSSREDIRYLGTCCTAQQTRSAGKPVRHSVLSQRGPPDPGRAAAEPRAGITLSLPTQNLLRASKGPGRGFPGSRFRPGAEGAQPGPQWGRDTPWGRGGRLEPPKDERT